MGDIKDIISLLQFLIPGFLSAWIFYGLTSYPKPTSFERIIQALVFTLFVNALVLITEAILIYLGDLVSFGKWSSASVSSWSLVHGSLIGVAFSYFANNDKLHLFLRKTGITRESSYPSEWYYAFIKPTYVVLHLGDGRRVYGWPLEWPSSPEEGHFVLTDMVWLEGETQIEMPGVETMLVCGKDVRSIQYMTKTWED